MSLDTIREYLRYHIKKIIPEITIKHTHAVVVLSTLLSTALLIYSIWSHQVDFEVVLSFIVSISGLIFYSIVLLQINKLNGTKTKLQFNSSIGKIIFHHKNPLIQFFIITAILLCIIFSGKYFLNIDRATINLMIIFLLIGYLFSLMDILVARYRIASGLYGGNSFEARELAEFIIKNSSKIDFTDGNKPKKIIAPEDLQNLADIIAKYPNLADLLPGSGSKDPTEA